MPSRLSDFRYPDDRVEIAQTPAGRRDEARLLVLDRSSGRIEHRVFREIPAILRAGDLVVLNDTRVFPARLRARRESGGRVEVLLVENLKAGSEPSTWWNVVGRPAKALAPGAVLRLEDDDAVTVTSHARDAGGWRVEFCRDGEALRPEEVHALCERLGEVPLPPYIRRATREERHAPVDRRRYQTVYASRTGAVAAPTAGLHFTEEVLAGIESAGIDVVRVTLHVGLGTFQPLTEASFAGDTLHEERFEIAGEAGARIREATRRGRRIVAVGTTSVRALESFDDEADLPYRARTNIFIKPGHRFRRAGALITNFHLPESSTLVLACAFAGRETLFTAYAEAIREGYRFYSYGDTMLIV